MEKKEGSGASNEISCDITSKNEKDDLEAPQDKFYVIYILFFFLGLVHLLPWSFFTTATEVSTITTICPKFINSTRNFQFWMYKFRNTSINETNSEFRTDLQAQFNATVMITLQVSEVAFLFVGVLWGRLISVRVRMIGIFTIIFTFFVILTIFVKVDTDSCNYSRSFFSCLFLNLCLQGKAVSSGW
jgi:equilibrative nucleoside transporter 1/2/3